MSRAHVRPDISLLSGKRPPKPNFSCGELVQTLSVFDFILDRTCRATASNLSLSIVAGIENVDCEASDRCFKHGQHHTYLQDLQGLMILRRWSWGG